MNYKNIVTFFYFGLALFCFVLIYLTSESFYAHHVDGYHNGFFINGWSDMLVNFNTSTGRWAQGLTNDYRFYTNRTLITVVNSLLFFGSLYLFIYCLFKRYAFIITTVLFFSILYNMYQTSHFIYLLHKLATILSYTLGTSLIFFFFSLYFKEKKHQSKYFVIIVIINTFILLFTTGLVEYLFVFLILLLGYIVLEDLFVSIKKKKLKVSKTTLYYLLIAIIGALIVLLSPGSRKRRVSTSKRLEDTEFGGPFNYQGYIDSLSEIFLSLFNLNNLILFIFLIVVFSAIGKEKNVFSKSDYKKEKSVLLTLFSLGLMFMPITVAFIASNGKVGLPKAYNFTSMSFIFLMCVLAYTVHVFFDIKFKKPIINIAVTLPFVFFSYAYTAKGNNLYFQQNQILSGNLNQAHEEIFARRQYLIETASVYSEKTIPTMSKSLKGQTFGYDNKIKKHKYYTKAFNNSLPVYCDLNLPKPREFTSMFLAMNRKIQPIYFNSKSYRLYFNKYLHTLVIENSSSLFNKKLTNFNIKIITENKEEEVYTLNLKALKKASKAFYSTNENFAAIVLPKNTIYFEVLEFEDSFIDLTEASIKNKITYKTNYENIMR